MATCKKTKVERPAEPKHLKIVERDPYLQPYEGALQARAEYARNKERELTGGQPLSEWASGYLFFGLHHTDKGWVLREWAPNATAIYIKGDMNNWQKDENYRLQSIGNGVWEAKLPEKAMQHGQMYKLLVEWNGGYGERIPSYVRRVVQDEQTKIFSAQVWNEPEYQWKNRGKSLKEKGSFRRTSFTVAVSNVRLFSSSAQATSSGLTRRLSPSKRGSRRSGQAVVTRV